MSAEEIVEKAEIFTGKVERARYPLSLARELDSAHEGEIEFISFDWSASKSTSSNVGMNEIRVFMPVNKVSPELFLACVSGRRFESALLTVRKPGTGGKYYLRWKLSDVLITSYRTAFSPGDEKPVDHITLSFGKIEIKYKETDEAGQTKGLFTASWDVEEGKGT